MFFRIEWRGLGDRLRTVLAVLRWIVLSLSGLLLLPEGFSGLLRLLPVPGLACLVFCLLSVLFEGISLLGIFS